ncbi:hypothetical protein GGI43DRAFT_238299 [Trichoderma evansii]
MSDHLSQPPVAVSGPKPDDGDDAASVVSERGDDASALDSDFHEALQAIETPGYLTSYFTLPEHSRSGLSVYNVGDISLPLGEIQARQIMGQAKRHKTFDRNHPWKLVPSKFKLDYSMWEGRLKALYRHIAPGIGFSGQDWVNTACATPSVVLLLEQNCGIDYHYLPNGVGHIMVYLPSADHQGGEIVVKFRDQEKIVFNPKKTEECFTSWYPNSKPLRLESGYALVIVFSFVPVNGAISDSALLVRDETRAIRHTLKRWLAKGIESRERVALYHPCERFYHKEHRLCLKRLRFADEGRVRLLKKFSEQFDFKVYLGYIEKDKKKLENSDRYEDVKGGTRITKLVDLDGRVVAKNLFLDEAHVREGFFDRMILEHEEPDKPSIRTGHITFFVVVPGDAILPFFLLRHSDNPRPAMDEVPHLLGHYARVCVSSQRSKDSISMFKELCELIWDSSDEERQRLFPKAPVFRDNDLIDVLKATIYLKGYSMFQKIAAAHEGSLPTSFFGWVPEHFHNSSRHIDKWFRPLEKGLSAAVLSYPRAKQQVRAVETFFPIIKADSGRLVYYPPECLIRWARQVLQESIKSCGSKKLDRRDGEALVKLSLYFEDPLAIISQVQNEIDPGSKPDAFLGFMSEIDLFGRYDYISYEKSQELYRKASKVFITSAAFTEMRGIEKVERTGTNFINRLGEFVFGESIHADESDDDDDYAQWVSEDEVSDDEGYTYDYFMDPHMDLDEHDHAFNPGDEPGFEDELGFELEDEPDSDPEDDMYPGIGHPDLDQFGYYVHNNPEYRAYQEYQLRGNKEEAEADERHIYHTALSFWIQKVMAMNTKYNDIFSLALSKMGEVAPQIRSADFHTLWIPVLRGMAPKMANLILEKSKDPNTLLWRKNIYILIKAYLDTYVGQWPRDPSLAQGGVGCGCADCKGLNVFLADASLKVGHFFANKRRCQHLIDELYTGKADVYAERKDIEGRPKEFKLIVMKSRTKTLMRTRIAWKERRDEASKQLGTFEQKHLAALLGPEWMTLFSMAHLGGPSLSDMDMRKALRMKTERTRILEEPHFMDPSAIAMFFGGGFPSMSMEEEFL